MTKSAVIALILLVAQPLLFFRRVLFRSDRRIPFDLLGFHTPLADYIAHALRQGEWPLWDPNPYCGYPIHADLQAQLFYPPAWLAIAARNFGGVEGTMFYWLEWLVVLHVILAGVLAFGFARRLGGQVPAALFAGTAFQLGAFFASQAQHLGAISGTAWLPLAWWAVWELRDRFRWRWFALLAMALAMSFLAGFAATTFVVWSSTVLVCLAVAPRRVWLVAMAFGAAVSLILVQLAPTMEWSGLSVASLRSEWNFGSGSPPRALWSLLWPDYHGVFTPFDPSKFTGGFEFTFLYCYCGLAAVVFGLWSLVRGEKTSRIFAGLAAAFFLLQMGSFLPGFDGALALLPRLLRGGIYMNFFLGPACLALVLAAAMKVSQLPIPWAWLIAVATACELIAVSANRPMNSAEESWRHVTSEVQIGASAKTASEVEALMRTQQPPWRLDVLDMNNSFTMQASLRRLPTPNGDNPFAPLRLLELRRLFAAGTAWERQYPVVKPESPLLSFLNVRYLLAYGAHEDAYELVRAGWVAAGRAENAMRFYRNENVQPRFFLVGRLREATDGAEALRLLPSIDLRNEAIVEGAPPLAVSHGGQVRVVRYAANAVDLETESDGASLLVSSESFHPDWRITADGAEVRLLRVNSAFRGAIVPAGRHRIEMRYWPRGFSAMLWISAVSWIVVLVAWARG